MLIGCCFIQDGDNKSNPEGRLEEGHLVGDCLRKTAIIPGRVGQVGRAVEGSADSWEVTRVFTHQTTSPDGGRGRTGTNSIRKEVCHVGPTTDRKATHKEFLKVSLTGPRGTSQGWWLSMGYASTREALSSSSVSGLLHTWCMR